MLAKFFIQSLKDSHQKTTSKCILDVILWIWYEFWTFQWLLKILCIFKLDKFSMKTHHCVGAADGCSTQSDDVSMSAMLGRWIEGLDNKHRV